MSVFRNAVQDCLHYDDPKAKKNPVKNNGTVTTNDAEVDKFSGLRIRLAIAHY